MCLLGADAVVITSRGHGSKLARLREVRTQLGALSTGKSATSGWLRTAPKNASCNAVDAGYHCAYGDEADEEVFTIELSEPKGLEILRVIVILERINAVKQVQASYPTAVIFTILEQYLVGSGAMSDGGLTFMLLFSKNEGEQDAGVISAIVSDIAGSRGETKRRLCRCVRWLRHSQ